MVSVLYYFSRINMSFRISSKIKGSKIQIINHTKKVMVQIHESRSSEVRKSIFTSLSHKIWMVLEKKIKTRKRLQGNTAMTFICLVSFAWLHKWLLLTTSINRYTFLGESVYFCSSKMNTDLLLKKLCTILSSEELFHRS